IAYETTRGAARFSVVERRYVIFPQRSGTIVIDPLVLEGRLGRRGSFFDRNSGRYVRKQSEALELEVRPIPESFTGQAWLPAEALQLTEQWPGNNGEWRAGEPLTRTLTIKARGLTASQLPEIKMLLPDGIRQYPDQPQLKTGSADKTTLSSRSETIALIPAKEGQYTLPAIEIPWWNTRSDTLEFARLPERTVDVLPSLNNLADSTTQPVPATAPVTAGNLPAQAATPPGSVTHQDNALFWQTLSAALALLWLATVVVWWWNRRTQPQDSDAWAPAAVMTDLQQACDNNDAVAAQSALLRWAKNRWPGNKINSLGALASRVDGKLQVELHSLSRALFSAQGENWNGSALWQACQNEMKQREQQQTVPRRQLEPLYRN
ncbi:MAG: hypothetical protein HKM98_03640, partial [Gammaproteobacteria bacterium]|nr:hypothetical protein [Gammaproteobacteria bacterium]